MSAINREKETLVDAEFLRSRFRYDSETGIFTNRAGTRVGALHHCGYIIVSVKRRNFRAHRLAWLYVYGRWPSEQIDHINGDRSDNRIINLREATASQNIANRRGWAPIRGVAQIRGRWVARVYKGGRPVYYETFDTPEEAAGAYAIKAKEIYGEFARLT